VTETASATDSHRAGELRDAMTDKLVVGGWVTSAVVERAFRVVPRHEFVPPGTSLADAYHEDLAPIAKSAADGTHLSSVTAAWLQARMIAQAGILPGMRVLEVGSGGYNAALLAEVTGKEGQVVTLDIDPDITARASAALAAAGYGGRVTVVTGDGEAGVPGLGPYDAIVVTAGAWDLPPAWTGDQLTLDGRLVVPLRLNTLSRSIGFRRQDGHLVSESWEMCGFVHVQGAGARPERSVNLPGPAGGHVSLRFDQGFPTDPGLLDGALATEQTREWSGVTIGHQVSFADLNLWLGAFLPGFCRVAASEGTELHAEGQNRAWFPFGGVHGDSFACLALHKLDGTGPLRYEFGAKAYGPHAPEAARALITEVREWDAAGRDLAQEAFAFWPAGTPLPPLPPVTAVFPKAHGTATAHWPLTSR
jgi:protein-L-isoaspartate(D-aspartate) O-methyltransferase